MKVYASFAKIDAEERLVYGYASTEAVDSHGEIVSREALAAALPDFMRFANIREMHQPSAVGRAEQAEMDDKGLYLAARIADDTAWAKIKARVYNGFSIAGRVTARDAADPTIITGCALTEISLVDRPANPEAIFDLYKSGARNSSADLARIQAIHDQAAALGADCDGDDDAPEPPEADMTGGDPEIVEKLAQTLGALERGLARLNDRLAVLESRPLPPRGSLKAISKADDLGDPGIQHAAADTHSLIKAAFARPRAF